MSTYPDDDDGQALEHIASEGSDMDRPMEIDFFVAVPSQTIGEGVAAAVKAAGFSPSVELDQESGEWTCYASRSMVATYESVVAAQTKLAEICEPLQGVIDGWGSYGNQPAQ